MNIEIFVFLVVPSNIYIRQSDVLVYINFFMEFFFFYTKSYHNSIEHLTNISKQFMPPNVFGAGIEELRRLETFVSEVSSYRRAVSELNELSRTMHMDPALVSAGGGGGSGGGGGGERSGEEEGEGGGGGGGGGGRQ